MRSRDDQPNINAFNFGVDSVFNNISVIAADIIPILPNEFLLLDTTNFLLLDGTELLLLGN
jgi:hypothetical protein